MAGFSTFLPLITSVLGAAGQNKNRNAANVANALTLGNSAITGQRAGAFDNQNNATNLLLQGLAGSFQAARGADADERKRNQEDRVAALDLEGRQLQNADLRSQIAGRQGLDAAPTQGAVQLPASNGLGSIFSTLGGLFGLG